MDCVGTSCGEAALPHIARPKKAKKKKRRRDRADPHPPVVAVASPYGAPTVLSPGKRKRRKKHKEKADPQPPVEIEAPVYDAPTDPLPVKRHKKKRKKDRAALEPPVVVEAPFYVAPTVPPPVRPRESSVLRESEPVSRSDASDLDRVLPEIEDAEAALQDDAAVTRFPMKDGVYKFARMVKDRPLGYDGWHIRWSDSEPEDGCLGSVTNGEIGEAVGEQDSTEFMDYTELRQTSATTTSPPEALSCPSVFKREPAVDSVKPESRPEKVTVRQRPQIVVAAEVHRAMHSVRGSDGELDSEPSQPCQKSVADEALTGGRCST
jgi:hypothetical protein